MATTGKHSLSVDKCAQAVRCCQQFIQVQETTIQLQKKRRLSSLTEMKKAAEQVASLYDARTRLSEANAQYAVAVAAEDPEIRRHRQTVEYNAAVEEITRVQRWWKGKEENLEKAKERLQATNAAYDTTALALHAALTTHQGQDSEDDMKQKWQAFRDASNALFMAQRAVDSLTDNVHRAHLLCKRTTRQTHAALQAYAQQFVFCDYLPFNSDRCPRSECFGTFNWETRECTYGCKFHASSLCLFCPMQPRSFHAGDRESCPVSFACSRTDCGSAMH